MKLTLKVLTLSLFYVLTSSAADQKTVNVYSSRHYDVDKKIFADFTKKTGITVNEVQIKEAPQLIERVKAEAGKADLILTADVGNLWRAEEAGILAPVKLSAGTKTPPAGLSHPDGLWHAISIRARVLAYNKSKVKPEEIATYKSLMDPKWKKRLLVRSSNHVYNQSLIASLIFHEGETETQKWVTAISDNLARKPQSGDTDQIKAVAAGIGDVAITNSYYFARLLKSSDPADKKVVENIGIVFPEQKGRGTHVNISSVSLAKGATHPKEAQALLEYLLTPEVQALFASENGEFPAIEGTPLPAHLEQLGAFKSDRTSLSSIGKNTPKAVKLTDASNWR